ncbi:hypothetical protein SNE40_015396 [Patella caerulea]|uniref:Uncharacterized protein n=1 Tax=Patella caerulea TaxID=87958 RepID=A0AAN8JKJ1_PATCE
MLGIIRSPVACLLIVICAMCWRADSGPIDNTCNSCTVNQADISCVVKELPYPCFLPEKEVKDFPHKPRNVTAKKHLENNSTWHLHVSWMLPYDFSYSVVSGFQMAVDSILNYVQIQTTRCYYFNLSTVDWSTVKNVHALEFRFDCLEYLATKNSRNLAITMYSLPKAAKNSEFTTVNVHLPSKLLSLSTVY